MKSNNYKTKVGAILLAAGLYLAVTFAANAQQLSAVLDAGAKKNQAGEQSQQRIDRVVDQTRSLLDQYRAVNKEVDGLVVYNTLLDRQIADQVEEMETLDASIDQVTVIERQIMPLMQRLIDGLEDFIDLDLPFLEKERADRIARLRELLERSDVTVAEKFRNVMEAYEIEKNYGSTLESYPQTVEIDEGTVEVDILRIGRLALLYQNRDASLTGRWDPDADDWVTLSGAARNQVRKGLKVAKKQLAPDLIQIPVPAPEAAQ